MHLPFCWGCIWEPPCFQITFSHVFRGTLMVFLTLQTKMCIVSWQRHRLLPPTCHCWRKLVIWLNLVLFTAALGLLWRWYKFDIFSFHLFSIDPYSYNQDVEMVLKIHIQNCMSPLFATISMLCLGFQAVCFTRTSYEKHVSLELCQNELSSDCQRFIWGKHVMKTTDTSHFVMKHN
jgi:hypothetical protein